MIVATRLRKGSANSARGAARLVADALKTSRGVRGERAAGAAGRLGVLRRATSSPPIRRARARFSITARKDAAVTAAIAAIGEDAWTTIRYPHAVFDEQLQQWVSDAEVAEIQFTAFASRGTKHAVTARLIVRRVRDANPDHVVAERPGRAVPGLAPPRRVHRLAPADARRPRPTTAATPSSNKSSPT